MRNSKYNQKIKIICQFLLAEGVVTVQKKMALGSNYYLDFRSVV